MLDISSRAMLAQLRISMWSARCLDRRITEQVNHEHNAAPDVARVNKRLVSKDAIATLQRIAGEARKAHESSTAPWLANGVRILSAPGYLAYAATMKRLRYEFESARDAFVAGYPEFVTNARLTLNGMFNESDYPSASDIGGRFAFESEILPWPQAADFRVTMADDIAAEIRADIERRTQAAIADAMRDVWQRVAERVRLMSEKLKGYKPADTKGERPEGVFRDSLVENVRELVALLPGLNVTGDAKLAAIADRMAKELCTEDADQLRDSATTRASVAAAADAILADVSEFIA